MNAMIDAACPKCRRKFGWCGTLASQPPCPACGHRPPQAVLDAEQAKMDALRQRLDTHPANADADLRRQQRIDAGLTLGQAAKLLGLRRFYLSSVEWGRVEPTPEECQRMAEVYGVREKP